MGRGCFAEHTGVRELYVHVTTCTLNDAGERLLSKNQAIKVKYVKYATANDNKLTPDTLAKKSVQFI